MGGLFCNLTGGTVEETENLNMDILPGIYYLLRYPDLDPEIETDACWTISHIAAGTESVKQNEFLRSLG
jgi:hypothetical protein